MFTVMIYPCGIAFLYLVYIFINLFKTVEDNKPFCRENVDRLKKSMYTSLLISVFVLIAFLIATFAYNYYGAQLKVALLFIAVIFFCAFIGLYVLSELFRQAAEYKEENDLTI